MLLFFVVAIFIISAKFTNRFAIFRQQNNLNLHVIIYFEDILCKNYMILFHDKY